jgi:hypothetical protein
VPRRNLVPFALVGVLLVLTAVFAVLGATSAPSGATVAVQNGSSKTFGSPTGSTSFAMDVVTSVAAGSGAPAATQVRLVAYTPPSRMAVYQVGPTTKLLGLLSQDAIDRDLSVYSALVGGSTPWTSAGDNTYQRTESLADYSARVPRAAPGSCLPVQVAVHGQVEERAVVRSGYFVAMRLTVVVPPQRLANGQPAPHGVEGQALVLTKVNGTRTRSLAP